MTFQLEVEFTGLCLYLIHEDHEQVGVVMPDARLKPAAIGAPNPMLHRDGSPAKAHVGYLRFDLADAGMVLPSDGNKPDPLYEGIHRFDYEELSFGLAPDQPLDDPVVHVPDLEKFAPGLAVIPGLFGDAPSHELLMRTRLQGGTLTSEHQSGIWTFDRFFNANGPEYRDQFTGVVKWIRKVNADSIDLQITSLETGTASTITLRPSGGREVVRLKVANLCSDNPVEWPELLIREFDGVFDDDFKWFYRLLDVPTRAIAELGAIKMHLPSPRLLGTLPGAFGGGTGESDCTGLKATMRD